MPLKEGTETRKDWEVVQEDVGKSRTDRLRIIGGWLYRTVVYDSQVVVAMVYVPGLLSDK